jgi:tetratricopeptide (TPR) repeat protein
VIASAVPMRASLAALLCACLAAATLPGASMTASAASAAEPSPSRPEVLYDEGRKAYRLGRFKEAVDKWEEAYALSDQPLLLYNISLAYKGLYTITEDVGDLRKAKAVLENFITLAQADASLDADDGPERLAELDSMIAEAQQGRSVSIDGAVEPPQPRPLTDDPGKRLRVAGAATMGAGGGLLVVSGALAAFYAVKGGEFRDEVARLNAEHPTTCGADMTSGACQQLLSDREFARDNGRAANLGLGLSLGIAGGLGLAALVAGAVVFVQGNRKTRAWESAWGPSGPARARVRDLRISPNRSGVSISGRF